MNYRGLATSIFSGVADKYIKDFSFIRPYLQMADIKIPVRIYISIIFFSSLMVYLIAFIPVTIITEVLGLSLIQKIAYFFFIPLMSAITCFAIFLFYPSHKAFDRRKSIEMNLPFVLTHMGAIVDSGVPPYIVFKLISRFEEYGEVSTEMKKIVKNVENFGLDPLSAVREVAERTPSNDLKQLLLGFVSTTESGGDVKLYLKNAGQQALFEWRIKREKFLQQLSAYAEFYTGLLIAAPLFIIALFAVMNLIQPNIGGYDILTLTKFSIYLLVPLLNGGFLLFLRGVEVEM